MLLITHTSMKFTLSIRAQWLRDTANQVVSATSMLKHHPLNFPGQFAHYGSLLSIDPHLATLVKAVIIMRRVTSRNIRIVSLVKVCLYSV